MKTKLKRLMKMGLIICGCVGVGFLLMVLVYLIPVDRMVNNAQSGVQELKKDDFSKHTDKEWCATIRDDTTDAIILSTAICDSGENVLSKAVKNQRIEFESISAYKNLIKYYELYVNPSAEEDKVSEKKEEVVPYAYTRYWNGYLTVIKPLLYLFDYKIIKVINYIIIFGLIIANMIMYIRIKKGWYIVPFVFFVFSVNPITMGSCLQYINVFVITLITTLVMMMHNKRLHEKDSYIYIFLISGISVAYFDLLTYPLVALGIPLVLYFILERQGLKQSIINMIKNSVCWGTGYLTMWLGKWIIATVITKKNVFKNVIETAKYRAGNEMNRLCDGVLSDLDKKIIVNHWDFKISYKDVLIRNLFGYCYITVISILFCLIAMGIFLIFDKRAEIEKKRIGSAVVFIVIALYPFIWYRVMINHSFGHFYYTSKNLCVTAFALLSMLVYIYKDCRKEETDEKI